MNFVKTIVAAGLVAASTSALRRRHHRRGLDLHLSRSYSKWADAYKKETGNGVNYQSIGSGAGIKQIQAKTVTFGATDMPLKAEQLEKDGLAQWPMIMGAIVPVVNIEGVKAGDMVFDGETLANIYLGKITKWDDPAIKKLNPKREAAVGRDRRRSPLGRLGHHLQLHRLSLQGQRRLEVQGRRPAPRSNGRSASAPRATKASPAMSARPRTRSVTSNMPTPSRTS